MGEGGAVVCEEDEDEESGLGGRDAVWGFLGGGGGGEVFVGGAGAVGGEVVVWLRRGWLGGGGGGGGHISGEMRVERVRKWVADENRKGVRSQWSARACSSSRPR